MKRNLVVTAARRGQRFRLLTEPASLKRRRLGWGRLVGGRFRLLTEPASLKLLDEVDRYPREAGSFRLLTEPASLKRFADTTYVIRAEAGFRLLTEPASLKHDELQRAVGCVHGFPAPHGAGLIEAVCRCSASRAASAGFPAPHGAGLIEAARARQAKSR